MDFSVTGGGCRWAEPEYRELRAQKAMPSGSLLIICENNYQGASLIAYYIVLSSWDCLPKPWL